MRRGRGARLVPLLLIAIVVIVVIAGIISIGRAIFSGTHGPSKQAEDKQSELLVTTSDHSVRLRVRGPIVAEESFKSYEIVVSPDSRDMTVYNGYIKSVQRSKHLSNNRKAYEQFVYALDKANMMKADMPDDDAKNDLRGICASGYVYEYSVLVDGDSVKRLWSSTCGGSKGTLNASVDQLNDLFLAQIPGSEDLIPFKSVPKLEF